MKNHDHGPLRVPIFTGLSDTYIKLADHRIIFISEIINDKMAADLSAMLLYFDNESHEEPIEMFIHSDGGEVSALNNIYDVMQMIQAPIKTVCIGKCYSAAAVLLAAGSKGQRFALQHSSIMIHGIQFGFPIPGHNMVESQNYFNFVNKNNDNLMKILSKHTGHALEKVKNDCKQDVFMNTIEAVDYGIIDYILI